MASDSTTDDDALIATVDANWRHAVQRYYDPDGEEELTTAVVFAIAETAGVTPSDMRSPPLYNVVDVPAIEAAFFGPPGTDGPRRASGHVQFQYRDYLVSVRSDGWIQVYEPADRGRT